MANGALDLDQRQGAAQAALPERDVRRKRPPALSFLLRMATLRRGLRVLSLLALDFAGVWAALFTALLLKALVKGGYDLQRGGALRRRSDARLPRLRLPADRPAVRALGPLRRALAAARPHPHRRLALPGDDRRACVLARERPYVLQLLHLLRLARARDRHDLVAALGPHARDRVDAGAPPATRGARCSSAAAATSTRSRTRSPARRTARSSRSATSRSRRGPTTGCARSASWRSCRRSSPSIACRT